jgi:glycosyltransferase involved in cell wall biosynthesis
MFTVIIAAYNAEKFILKTINSLQEQSFKDWEAIISVNGSTDKTLDIANGVISNDKRFKVINSNIANKSSALNRAIFYSSNDWISILDADDLWLCSKLEHQKKFIESNPNIDIIGTQVQYIDENDNFISKSPQLPIRHNEIVDMLNQNENSMANSSIVYKKNIHDIIGYYNPELFGTEDYDFWKRCRRFEFKFANLNEKYFLHRIHSTSNFNSSQKQEIYKNLIDENDVFLLQLKKQNFF